MASLEDSKKLRKTQPMQDCNKENQVDQYGNEFQEYTQKSSLVKNHRSKSYLLKPGKNGKTPNGHQSKNTNANNISVVAYKELSIHELKNALKERSHQVTLAKQAIVQKRNKMRDIQTKIDKQVMKSIMQNGRKNITIRQIFNENGKNKMGNQKLNGLTSELQNLRKAAKEEKSKLKKFEEDLNDPVNRKNSQQALALHNIIVIKQSEINAKTNEKNTLQNEIERMYRYLPAKYVETMHEQQTRLKQNLSKLIRDINTKKIAIYQTEKLDISLMEKGKFLGQMIQLMEEKKRQEIQKNQKANSKIHSQMKTVSDQIFKIYQKRLQIQAKRNATYEAVKNTYQAELKNKEQLQKQIRNVEGYFMGKTLIKRDNERRIQHAKLQKIQQQKSVEKMKLSKDKSEYYPRSIPRNRLSPSFDSPSNSNCNSPKKSIKEQIQLSNSRQFSQKSNKANPMMVTQIDNQGATQELQISQRQIEVVLGNFNQADGVVQMKDQLFNKSVLQNITLITNQEFIFGVIGTYQEQNQNEKTQGSKMVSKVLPKNLQKKSLSIGQKQHLSKIKIGFNHNNMIVYAKLQVSSEKTVQWGKYEQNTKFEEKSIPNYQTIQLKAALNHTIPQTAANTLCLVGIGFQINI